MKKIIVCLLLFMLASGWSVNGQTLNETITNMSSDIGTTYGESALNSFAANLNSAWLNQVPEATMTGFNFRVGLYGMLSPITKGPETFQRTGSFFLTEEQATEIVGDEVNNSEYRQQIIDQLVNKKFNFTIDGVSITSTHNGEFVVNVAADEDLVFAISDPEIPFPVDVEINADELYTFDVGNYLAAFDFLPHGTLQFNIGTVAGTEAMIRFIPAIDAGEDAGNVGMYGFGLLHNPQVWFDNELPVELSVGFMTQKFHTDKKGDISSFSAGLNVRKTFGFDWVNIAPFINFMMANTKFDLKHEITFDTNYGSETVEFRLNTEAANKFRVGLGTLFEISFFDVTVSYNFSEYNSLVGGIGFNF